MNKYNKDRGNLSGKEKLSIPLAKISTARNGTTDLEYHGGKFVCIC